MLSRTVDVSHLEFLGACLEITLTIDTALERFMRAQGQPIPTPRPLQALIDIGARRTAIEKGILDSMGLHHVAPYDVRGIGNIRLQGWCYPVRLILGEGMMADCNAASMEIGVPGIDCLIGRDVLAHAELIYRGRDNNFTLTL